MHISPLSVFKAAAIAAPLILGIQAGFAEEAPVPGGALNIVVNSAPRTLVNLLDSNRATANIAGKIVEGLLRYDEDFTPQPLLATSWDVAPDGLTYTFHLREGVKWHDGTAFTSEDVKFSIETLKKFGPRAQITFANLESVETPDEDTAIFHLSQPAPFLIRALSSTESPIVPAHAYPNPADPHSSPNNNAPIGTGPFKLTEWVQGSHIILTKNEDYWREGLPYLDQINFRFVGDVAAASVALETGEADVSFSISNAEVERLKTIPDLEVIAKADRYLNNTLIVEYNFDNETLAIPAVRHAIAHAIDKDFIRDWVYYGLSEDVTSIIPATFTNYFDDSTFSYPHDVEKANQLLDEAGFPRGADGTRFRLKLAVFPGFKAGAEHIRAALSDVGIRGQLEEGDLAAHGKKVYTDRDFDLNITGMSLLFDPTAGIQRLYWAKGLTERLIYINGAHYDNPEVEALFAAAAVEADEAKRAEQFKQIQYIVGEELPVYPLAGLTTVIGYRDNVHNVSNGIELHASDFAEAWIAPK